MTRDSDDLPAGARDRETVTFDPEDTEVASVADVPAAPPEPAIASVPRESYQREGEIARGGGGVVTRAADLLDRRVAIKEHLGRDARAERRFLREALITARLQHPGIVPVYQVGRWPDGSAFYSMKLIDGRSLAEALAAAGQSRDERLALIPNLRAVADTVGYAHHEGIIHRDLKPSNVMLGPFGETLVVDWGLAKRVGEPEPQNGDDALAPVDAGADAPLTVAGSIVGTPSYMPPEQAAGQRVDARADVYSLGAMLYHLVCGRAPYRGPSSDDVLSQVRQAPPEPLSAIAPDAPAELAAIVTKAMAREPADRYANAGALADDLRRYETGQLVAAYEYSAMGLVRRWMRRHRAVTIATAVFATLAIAGGAWFVARNRSLRERAEAQRDAAELERQRARAEEQRATEQTLRLLEAQGRAELATGRPRRAAAYAVEALRRDPERMSARSLISQAIGPVEDRLIALGDAEAFVSPCGVHPAGDRVAAFARSRVQVWNLSTGAVVATLVDGGPRVRAACFDPLGSRVVTGGDDHVVRVLDATSGAVLATFEGHTGPVWATSFDPTGTRILSASFDRTARIWDVATGRPIAVLRGHAAEVRQAAFAPTGDAIATGGIDGNVLLWSSTGARRHQLAHDEQLLAIAFSHRGDRLACADASGQLTVWEVATGKRLQSLRLPDGRVPWQVGFDRDDRAIIAGAGDGTLHVLHATSGSVLASVDVADSQIKELAVTPDGRHAVVSANGEPPTLWRLPTAARVRIVDAGVGDIDVQSGRYIGDGSRAVFGTADGDVVVVNLSDEGVATRFHAHAWTWLAEPSPDGSLIVTSGVPPHRGYQPDDGAKVWDAATGALVHQFAGHTNMVFAARFLADDRVVTASWDDTARVWNPRTGAPASLPMSPARAALAVHPSGRELLVGVESLAARDARSGEDLDRRFDVGGTALVAAYHPGGSVVAVALTDTTTRLLRATDGTAIATLHGHDEELVDMSFSPDGRRLATASFDRTARLWDARTGEELRVLRGPSYAAQFRPDGRALLTTGRHGEIVVWDVALDDRSPDELAAAVRRHSPWRLQDGRLTRASSRP